MTEESPRLLPRSPRAEQLIEAWNRRDFAFVLDQFNDNVVLEAHSPKVPRPVPNLNIQTKAQLAAALEAYRALHSRFSIISASEDAGSILLALEDAEGDVLVLRLEFADNGKISRMVSYRSGGNAEQ